MTSLVPSLIASLFSMLMTQFIHTGDVKALMHRGEKYIAKAKLYFNMNSLLLNANKTQYMFVAGCSHYNIPRVCDVNEHVVNTRQQQQLNVPKFPTSFMRKVP